MVSEIDLVTLELIQEYLVAAVREMRVTMIMTAYSSIIYEGHDFSCALLDANGQLVAQSEDSPAHVVPLPSQVGEAKRFFGADLHDGDVILVNDPYTSGTHMNDVAMIVPHFSDGELLAFAVTRAHWGDVGGMTPGSISGDASEIFQEGLRIPFVKVYERSKPVQALLDLIFANVRVPQERTGDFDAMRACCATGQQRLQDLERRFGRATVRSSFDALLERSELRMRRAIRAIPSGTYRYEDYLDGDRDTGNPILLTVAIKTVGDRLEADFTGSANQVSGPTNASLAVTEMGTFVALKALLDPHGPINQGAFRAVSVRAPEGTIVNVRYPGAVGGYTEIRRRVESVVMGALARAVPQYVAGDIKGTSNHTYIGSSHPQRGDTIFYEYPAGGTGGFLEHDGGDAMRAYDEGDFSSIQPAEAVELQHALLVESCSLRSDSCGDGRQRGGLGLRREIRLLAGQGQFSELSDRNIIPPFGVCGGYAAAPNRFYVRRAEKTIEPSRLPGKVSGFVLRENDVVVIETAGGGGYGSPLDRDPDLVAHDVRFGYISRQRARKRYGVVLRRGGVDVAATDRERRSLREATIRLRVIEAGESGLEYGRRICRLNPEDAVRLGEEQTLIEVVNPNGAPLRMWLMISAATPVGSIPLDSIALGILGADKGTVVDVRSLRTTKRTHSRGA